MCVILQAYKQQNGVSPVQSSRFLSFSPAVMPYPRRLGSESPSTKWAAAASLSDARRTESRFPFHKDRSLTTKFTAQRPQSVDSTRPVDARRGRPVPPTRKFDDTDEEAQSPMVTSYNGTTQGLPGIPSVMTSSLCSTNGDEPFSLSSGCLLYTSPSPRD